MATTDDRSPADAEQLSQFEEGDLAALDEAPRDRVERDDDGVLQSVCCKASILTTAQPYAAECEGCGATLATDCGVIDILTYRSEE